MGRKSTIESLPQDILEKLQELLRDPRVDQLEATQQINAILERSQAGMKVSKSAVNRYAIKMEKVGARLRESREIAKMWIGKFGAAPQGEVGKLLNEVIRNLAFETTMHLAEDEKPADPKLLSTLALAVQRLEASASENLKRDEQIRRQEREVAAEKAAQTAKQNGVSEETIAIIRRDVLRMEA